MKSCKYCGNFIMPAIGTKIKADVSGFYVTKGKIYEVLGYGRMFGSVVIANDQGDKAEYTLEYLLNKCSA